MADFNKIILIGNLTRDPEQKTLPSGTQVATFGIASNRSYKAKNGDTKSETCFVDVVTFDKLSETVTNYLAKGRQILVEGRLQFRTWDDKDGQRRSKHEIIADRVVFLGAKPEGEQASTPSEEVPF